MALEFTSASWYAVRVRSNREHAVSAALRGKGFEDYLPLYRSRRVWSDRVKDVDLPLFAGYVFCWLDPACRLPVLTIPGVVGIVGTRQGPLPVDSEEIAALRKLAVAGAATAPWPFLQAGQRVRVDRGPLRGLDGLLVQVKSQYRLVLSVTILQRSVGVEVDRDSITPLGHRPPALPVSQPAAPPRRQP